MCIEENTHVSRINENACLLHLLIIGQINTNGGDLMDLLNKLLHYSKDALSLRNNMIECIKKCKKNFDSALLRKNNDIAKMQDELKKIASDISVCKNDIKSKITTIYQQKAYGEFSSSIDSFNLISSLIVGSKTNENELEKAKQKLLSLLSLEKEIINTKIPQLEKEKNEIQREYDKQVLTLKKDLCVDLDKIRIPLINEYSHAVEHCSRNYDLKPHPIKVYDLPQSITIGNYKIESNNELKEITAVNPIRIPVDIDVRNSGNIILKIDSNQLYDNDHLIEKTMTGIAMKYIESFPAGHLKVGIYSSSITSFGRLNALLAASVKGKIAITQEACKTREQFAKLLLSVSQKGEMINSKLLDNNCVDLYELYEKDIKVDDFQLLIIHDVFREMTLDNINQLHGCISELSKCGIRFIIIDDFGDETYKNKPTAFVNKLNQILECGSVFNIKQTKIDDNNEHSVELISSGDADTQGIYAFINQYCEYTNENKLSYLPYEKVGFGNFDADKNNFESIVIPVALNTPDVWNIEFDIVGKSPNANLIVGIPGTGKSTLIDSLIMNGSMKYSPDELNFQLLDFKDGISSSVYTMEDCKIPHIKVVSQNNKPEEAEIILSNILAESERRNKEFMSLRNETNEAIRNIVEYNKRVATGKYGRKNMPRLIIVIDECQYLFEDEGLAKKCQDIVRKCRSQGIHLILATQTLSYKMWSTVKFVEGIYCFEIAKDDAEQLLNRKYIPLIATEIPKGSYMAFASNNSGLDCAKIRIAFDGGNTSKYSSRIREKWSKYTIDLVTIGDKSAKQVKLDDFDDLLFKCDTFELPIGENYNNHEVMTISYEKRRPLFLAGTCQKVADSILKLVAYTGLKRQIKTYVIDASDKQELKLFLNSKTNNNSEFEIGDERNYLEILQRIYDIYKEREENLRANYAPIFLIVNGLQSISDFLNNKKLEPLKVEEGQPIDKSKLTMKEIIELSKRQKEGKTSSTIHGKETLIPFLISNAYKANIFICLSLDTLSLTSDSGEQVLYQSQKNIIKTSDYKILYPNCSSDIRSIMEDSFREKMLGGLSEDMAFVSYEQREFYKIRYYQLSEVI